MTENLNELREKHRLEWENIVITKINQGFSKSDAKQWADECILSRYMEETE